MILVCLYWDYPDLQNLLLLVLNVDQIFLQVVCAKCSENRVHLPWEKNKVRVCKSCILVLRQEGESDSGRQPEETAWPVRPIGLLEVSQPTSGARHGHGMGT